MLRGHFHRGACLAVTTWDLSLIINLLFLRNDYMCLQLMFLHFLSFSYQLSSDLKLPRGGIGGGLAIIISGLQVCLFLAWPIHLQCVGLLCLPNFSFDLYL